MIASLRFRLQRLVRTGEGDRRMRSPVPFCTSDFKTAIGKYLCLPSNSSLRSGSSRFWNHESVENMVSPRSTNESAYSRGRYLYITVGSGPDICLAA